MEHYDFYLPDYLRVCARNGLMNPLPDPLPNPVYAFGGGQYQAVLDRLEREGLYAFAVEPNAKDPEPPHHRSNARYKITWAPKEPQPAQKELVL